MVDGDHVLVALDDGLENDLGHGSPVFAARRSEARGEFGVAVADDEQRADDEDLDGGDGGDRGIEVPLQIGDERDLERGAAGPTRKIDFSRSMKEMTKENSAAATMAGRIIGSVTRRNTVKGAAPREEAASSQERLAPARPAVTSRTVQGSAMRQWATSRPPKVPVHVPVHQHLQLDEGDEQRRAADDDGHHHGCLQQRLDGIAARKRGSAPAQGSRNAEPERDDHRAQRRLQRW